LLIIFVTHEVGQDAGSISADLEIFDVLEKPITGFELM
jgi:hypothetical protein